MVSSSLDLVYQSTSRISSFYCSVVSVLNIFCNSSLFVLFQDAQTETFPYAYYTPNYGCAQSPYNPYNPYIPGAVVGVDAPCAGPQHYYTIPSYENPGFPVVVPSTSGIIANAAEPIMDTVISTTNRADGLRLKRNLSPTSPMFTPIPLGPASGHKNASNRGSESAKLNAGSSKQPASYGFSSPSSQVHPVRNFL